MTRREPAEPPTDLGRPWAGGLTERVGMHCVASRVIAARPRPAQVERLLRDARAAHLMSPTTVRLETGPGRSPLGLPLP